MKYRVRIEEVLSRIEEVEANSKEEAIDIVKQMHKDEEIVLSADDFETVSFYAMH